MSISWWVGPPDASDTYELVQLLGAGGEGEVWRGELRLSAAGRHAVAVKIMRTDASPDDERTWTRFGHLLRALAHPGLVRVTAAFVGAEPHHRGAARPDGRARYLVMDFVEGTTLTEWCAENPDATAAVRLRSLRMVASALDEMHSGARTGVAVVHGDVTASNIVVTPRGASVLVDLGLARTADGADVPGYSSAYAAPEIRTTDVRTTPASDAFAFAATTAAVLTGRPLPTDARGFLDVEILGHQLRQATATRRRPALVRHVLAALTARAPDRPTSLGTWLAAATDTLSQVTGPPAAVDVVGPPPAVSPSERDDAPVPPQRASRSRWAPAVAAVGVLAVLAAGTTAWFAHRGGPEGSGAQAGRPASNAVSAVPVQDRSEAAVCSDRPRVWAPTETDNPDFTVVVDTPCPTADGTQRWLVEELLDIGSTDLHSEFYLKVQLPTATPSTSVPMNVSPSIDDHRRLYVVDLTADDRAALHEANTTDSGGGYWGGAASTILDGAIVSNIVYNVVAR